MVTSVLVLLGQFIFNISKFSYIFSIWSLLYTINRVFFQAT